MKGYERRLTEFMDGRKKRFIIPVYQRNYDWKTENCKQLFDDLVRVVRERRHSHFFGALVFTQQMDDHVIIDGQQRLTTVSLLLLAMSQLLNAGQIHSSSPNLADAILEDYLIDKRAENETRIKLKPIKDDQLAFRRLFEPEDEQLAQSNLSVNFRFFCEQLKRNLITPDELYSAIQKLEIIAILLDTSDNPQLIFESLNSTGLDLSEGDKIRNYILIGLEAGKQEKYYDVYWNRVEKYTDYDVTSFIRDYLSVKLQSTPAMRNIYITFKDYMSREAYTQEVEPLLRNLREYASRYARLLHGGTKIASLDACIQRLNQLESTVTRPYFLEILRMHENGALTDTELTAVFATVEAYLFRRLICDVPTNTLNKTFLLLNREILRLDGGEDNYLDKLRYVLGSKQDKQRFPDNQEFSDCLTTRNIYDMQPKNKKYLFERLENSGTSEVKDVWARIESGVYTIEHIMPQHLTPAWMGILGDSYDEIHRMWLHRLANLTLTAYNSSYGNRTFAEKRDVEHGFRDSGIRMNQSISRLESWGLPEMERRNEELATRALKIWPMDVSNYSPLIKPQDMISLDDDASLTSKSIIKFSFRGAEQPVASWVDMYMQVLGILHHENRAVLSRLATERDNSVELALMVTDSKQESLGVY